MIKFLKRIAAASRAFMFGSDIIYQPVAYWDMSVSSATLKGIEGEFVFDVDGSPISVRFTYTRAGLVLHTPKGLPFPLAPFKGLLLSDAKEAFALIVEGFNALH